MDGETVSAVLTESASQVYQYIADMQYVSDPPLGVSVTAVSHCDVHEGFAVLHIDGAMPDPNGLMLKVGDVLLQESEAGFDRYDETSRTMVVRPGNDILSAMSDGDNKVSVLSDMKFLVAVTGEFYRRYGHLLTLPVHDVRAAEPRFPEGSDPNSQQLSAVDTILGNRLSYIWGSPGTGKTQYVLATCIRAIVESGGRVAVFAPTNNSVEQVLRGVIKAFGDDETLTGSILRLGVPTRGFYQEYPWMCEDRQAQRRIGACIRTLECLEEVMFERACDELEGEILELQWFAESLPVGPSGKVIAADHPELEMELQDMGPFLSSRAETRDLLTLSKDEDAREVLTELIASLYDRERPAADIEEYSEWSDEDLMCAIMETEREIRELASKATAGRMGKAAIIAATPHQFLSRFRPRGSKEDGRPELDVDHIFLDEAGYCGLVQATALFTNGVPVTFLGDHMQLPPVTQLDEEVLRSAARRGGMLKYGYLWAMSSLYTEMLIRKGPGCLVEMFLEDAEPEFESMAQGRLTTSHRFGANLADVLDRFVYSNGLRGSSQGGDLEILCIDAVCTSREGRDNRSEAEAVRDYLRSERPDPGDVAILTPYSVQLALIKKLVGRRYRDCAMTVHGSQGREWDTVVLSVADNGICSRDVPFRFTGSDSKVGLRVINTAVSRARRRLVLVCDREFWCDREGELISGILREVPPEGVRNFNR